MSQDKPVLTAEQIEEFRAVIVRGKRGPIDVLSDEEYEARAGALCDLALSALERQGSGGWAERAMCEAIVATQDGSSGRMVCDVERLLHHFNSRRPQVQDAQTEQNKVVQAHGKERNDPQLAQINEPPQEGHSTKALNPQGVEHGEIHQSVGTRPASGSPDEGKK